ncbi:UNKNOWN [Stylonychia lemnae]|uniref:Accessory gland protein n=1 Tax=Stylonychia lemnae TaxID=5949 RepID=A0A077ZU11_STYLE|nr:UNKNOWN [Stylonychia lemnae]|eukprot:CDW73064.1 UNKNOWN [Stylonychia lemnae]
MEDKFKGFDWFGQSIQLTYKGEDSYKTIIGASVSFVLILVLLGFSIFKAYNMLNRVNPEFSRVSLIRDMTQEEIFLPQLSGFDFAFGLNEDLDPRIGHFTVKQFGLYQTAAKDSEGRTIKNITKRDIPFEKCGKLNFNYPNETEIVAKGISNFICTTTFDYQFRGNYYTDSFEYLEVKLQKCIDPPNATKKKCFNQTYIDSYLDKQFFNFVFVNNYFDLTNFEKGKFIKPFIDDSLFFEIEAKRMKKANFYIQAQEAELEDDLIQFGQSHQLNFHQVSNSRSYDNQFKEEEGFVIAIYLRFDNKYDLYTRKVYSALELLGDIGGLYGSLLGIGFFFVGFISSRMFMSDIMKKIYQVRKYVFEPDIKTLKKLDEMEQSQNNNQRSRNNKSSDNPGSKKFSKIKTKTSRGKKRSQSPQKDKDQDQWAKTTADQYSSRARMSSYQNQQSPYQSRRSYSRSSRQGSQRNSPKRSSSFKTKQQLQEEYEIKENEIKNAKEFKGKKVLGEDDINSLLMSFVSRMSFNYQMRDILQYLGKCLCLRDLSKKRQKRYYKKHYLFNKGEEKLSQELDIIQLLKTQRKFRLLAQALLSQKHRMLLRFQRQNLIETATESSDSDDNNLDTFALMENKNPLIRLVIYGKVKKMIKAFQGKKLKNIEKNLMRGVFQRKIKDFQEDQNDQNENKTLLQRLHDNLINDYEIDLEYLYNGYKNTSQKLQIQNYIEKKHIGPEQTDKTTVIKQEPTQVKQFQKKKSVQFYDDQYIVKDNQNQDGSQFTSKDDQMSKQVTQHSQNENQRSQENGPNAADFNIIVDDDLGIENNRSSVSQKNTEIDEQELREDILDDDGLSLSLRLDYEIDDRQQNLAFDSLQNNLTNMRYKFLSKEFNKSLRQSESNLQMIMQKNEFNAKNNKEQQYKRKGKLARILEIDQ